MIDNKRSNPTLIEQWKGKLAEMKANRDPRFGRTPKDDALEDRLMREMEVLFESMTEQERNSVERPLPPRRRTSLIAQDEYGRLIGYEDLDD